MKTGDKPMSTGKRVVRLMHSCGEKDACAQGKPSRYFNDLWKSDREPKKIGEASLAEQSLFWLYVKHFGVCNYNYTDLAVTGYAYDQKTTNSILGAGNRHGMIAEMIMKNLIISIKDRLNLWADNVEIGLDDNLNIYQFS